MRIAAGRLLGLVATAVILGGCLLAPFGGDMDPSQVPTGEPDAPGVIGPVDVRAEGVSHGIGWRYYIFETDQGWCTGMDLGDGSGSLACGGLAHAEDAVFRSVGSMSRIFEGVVSEEAADVSLLTDDGNRISGTMLRLQRPGLDGSAFVVTYPEGSRPETLVATDENNNVIEEFDVRAMVADGARPPRPPDSG